jgi:hypothetical protein
MVMRIPHLRYERRRNDASYAARSNFRLAAFRALN